MAWAEAKTAGDEWVAKNLPEDLRGHALQLVNFASDSHCRFFYASRPEAFHRMITTAIGRTARKRGAKTVYATITPDAYREWLGAQGKQDSDAVRLEFIESCHHLSQV